MRSVLRHPQLDAAFKELVLTLPSKTYIAEQLDVVDPQRVHAVREAMRAQLATALRADWAMGLRDAPRHRRLPPDPISSGRRALAGLALAHAVPGGARIAATRCGRASACQRFKDAGNMTDRFNALNALVSSRPRPGGAGAGALPRDLQGRGAGASTSGSRCRPARTDRGGDILPLVQAAA